jgi:kinesin family protein 6/9
MYINQSLTYLEQCVVALTKKGQAHIPFRQTKLTSVLKDSLGGNCNTLMFAAVWGEAKHLEETVSTLKLAQRMMRVQNNFGLNVQTDPAMLVKKYERQIKELKQELMMHDTLAERSNVMYDEYTPEQRLQMSQWVRSYVDAQENSEPELKIESVRQVQELMRQFKALVKAAESNAMQMRSQSRAGGVDFAFDGTAGSGALGGMTQNFPENEGDFVGDVDEEGGYGVGTAPDFARPTTVDTIATRRGMSGADSKVNSQGSPKKMRDTGDAKASMPPPPDAKNSLQDKDESFAMYKINQGRQLNSELAEAKAKFKLAKQRTKNAADAVNQTKSEIDEVEAQLRLKEDERAGQSKVEAMEDFVDEEEFRLMTRRKEKKREYRAHFENLKALKEEMGQASNHVEVCRSALLSEFETWYAALMAGAADPDEDKLDESEAFDQLEISRVVNTDPDSLAFFQSQKKMRGMQVGSDCIRVNWGDERGTTSIRRFLFFCFLCWLIQFLTPSSSIFFSKPRRMPTKTHSKLVRRRKGGKL